MGAGVKQLLLVLAVCVAFAAAQRSDWNRDENERPEWQPERRPTPRPVARANATRWAANLECTINSVSAPKNYLFMSSFWTGRTVQAKRFDKVKKEARWRITPVQTAGATYFELKNVDRDTYTAPFGRKGKGVTGNFGKFTDTKSTNTLWIIDPARQNAPVTIKSFDGKVITETGKSGVKSVELSKSGKSKWIINCD